MARLLQVASRVCPGLMVRTRASLAVKAETVHEPPVPVHAPAPTHPTSPAKGQRRRRPASTIVKAAAAVKEEEISETATPAVSQSQETKATPKSATRKTRVKQEPKPEVKQENSTAQVVRTRNTQVPAVQHSEVEK